MDMGRSGAWCETSISRMLVDVPTVAQSSCWKGKWHGLNKSRLCAGTAIAASSQLSLTSGPASPASELASSDYGVLLQIAVFRLWRYDIPKSRQYADRRGIIGIKNILVRDAILLGR
jgi:hypothetical protein